MHLHRSPLARFLGIVFLFTFLYGGSFSVLSGFILPSAALAAAPRVITVPQLPSDPLVPHETWSGEPTILKGIARDYDGDLAGGSYYWQFGDGEESAVQAIANPDNLSVTHTYTADPGTLIIARLHVTDAAGESSSDEYRIVIRERNLDVEVNKAIDDGLWWLYTNRQDGYELIPASVLFTPEDNPGLTGEYFNNTSLSEPAVLVRDDAQINFYWGGSPGTGVTSDNFSVRWSGEIAIPADGAYRFATRTDDGVRLYIDGIRIINDWQNQGPTWNYSGAIHLAAGRHEIVMEYYEATGGATAELHWSPERYRWQNYYATGYSGYYANPTASAVQAFEINGHLQNGNAEENPYVHAVAGGLDYLFSVLRSDTIDMEAYGDPDTNGNGIGLSVNSDRSIYESGAVMDAFVATGTPDETTSTGGVNVLGRTYKDIVQDMVDMYAWGQGDWVDGGGWRYVWNEWPDNSASQWGAIGMIPAEVNFGCTVPDWVKEQNNRWLNRSYNGTGFGYTSTGNDWATTPSGMVQLAFAGYGTDDSRWQTAEAWLATNWASFITTGRDDRYYSYYAFAKAMRLALPDEVTHLATTGLDWYGDDGVGLARILVDRQSSDGSWPYDGWPYVGQRTAAAWNVIILTRTLFEKPPVAVIHAEPNPGAVGQTITFDASGSYHVDPAKNIVQFLWDFDAADGVDFDHPDATGVTAQAGFGVLADYTVTLKVIDDSTPARFDTSTLVLRITIPPHPPTAVVGGPYLAGAGENVQVDGSASYDIDAPEGDSITAWDWESDFIAPYDFAEASGKIALLPPFADAGRYDIGLKVTDNTSVVFPEAGQPDLTNVDYGEVTVYNLGVTDLSGRAKETKCQLVWTPLAGAEAYRIFRSESGPNHGFYQIGTTLSTYSTFLDHNLAENAGELVNTCLADFTGDTVVDASDESLFAGQFGSTGCDPALSPCYADFDGDGDVDGRDQAFFLAELGRDDCLQMTGLELDKDYWYRVMTEIDGEMLISTPAYVYSQGRIVDLPPEITSEAPVTAEEGSLYEYDVEAWDPEGTSLTYLLDLAPAGMDIDGATGLVSWIPERSQWGAHDVMVRVRDEAGVSATQFYQVVVSPRPNSPPVAVPDGPYSSLVGEEVFFDGSGSSDPEGDPIVGYRWVFGDGGEEHGVQVSHIYNADGKFTVTLYVTDDRGAVGHTETTCQVELPNRLPIAVAGGPYEVEVNSPASFDGSESYDPDNDPLTYTWNFGDSTPPETGMTVTHTYTAEGLYYLSLSVDDGRGGIDTDQAMVNVTPPNQPPTASFVMSGDPLKWQTLTFDGSGSSDPEGRQLSSWEWDFGDGATTTGTIVNHAYAEPGDYTVTLTVTDDRGLTDSASETITIEHPVNNEPYVDAGGPYQGAIHTLISMTASGGDPDGDSLSYSWLINGQTYTGQTVSSIYPAAGTYQVTVTASDGYGGTAQDTAEVIVYDPNGPIDEVPPQVAFTSPAAGDTLKGTVAFSGTVADDNLALWRLEYARAGSGNWQEAATGTTGVADGLLAEVDVSLWPDDFYRFRLTAYDANQSSSTWMECRVSDPVKLGRFKISYEDLNVPVMALDIKVQRSYDSIRKDYDDYGYGWTLDIKTSEVREDASHNVFITMPDGRRIPFVFTPVQVSPWFPIFEAKFTAPPGVYEELDFVGNHTVVQSGDDWYFFMDSAGVFNPDTYILKTKRGFTYTISQTDGVNLIEDRNGNSVTISESGITSSTGYGVSFDRDGLGRITTMTDPDGNEIHYAYDSSGDLVRVTYPSGEVMQFSYDADHYLTGIIDPTGRTAQQYEYDADGRLISSTNDDGAVVTFTHDPDNRHETVTDARGFVSHAYFDERGNKIREIDPLGNRKLWSYDGEGNISGYEIRDAADTLLRQMSLVYDPKGNPTEIVLPDGGVYHMTYNLANHWQSVTTPDGKNVSFGVDSNYNITSMTDALGRTTSYTYDGAGNRTSVTDPLGRTTTFEYDGYGHLVRVTDSCGNVTRYTRDFRGNVLTYTRPDGGVITHQYDGLGHKTGVTDALGNTTTYTYDGRGNLLSETDANGNTTSYEYNSRDKLIEKTNPDGSRSRYEYDAGDNLVRVIDENGNQTGYEYDAAGRLIRQIDGLGNITAYEYDAEGQMTAMVDPLGRRTVYQRNPHGRISAVIDAAGNTTSYEYNLAGRITRLIDANNNSRSYEYENWSRLTREILPDGRETSYTYDAAGNRITRTDALGQTTTYSYDPCNRLTAVDYPDGSGVDYTYDALGNRLTMTDATGLTSYSYDGMSRLLGVETPGGAEINYAYDPVGNIVSIEDPAGTVQKGYDSRNRLFDVRDRTGGLSTYTYDPAGNLLALTQPNGTQVTYGWDAADRLTSIAYDNGLNQVYSYDAVGNVISRAIGGQTLNMTYDAVNRLVGAVDPANPGTVLAYSYDPAGNRLTAMENGVTTAYSYNANDELIQPDRTFDANGNLVSDSALDYHYDYENRLTGISSTATGTVIAAYVYNGDGHRVRTVVGGEETVALIDPNAGVPVVRIKSASGGDSTAFTYGNGLLSMLRQGAVSYMMHDAIGSVVGLADANRVQTDSYRYDPFGRLTARTGSTDQPFGFAAQQFDSESGLYHMRARQYDPAMGRFISRDPAMGRVAMPVSFHPYLYGNANPLIYVDPMGTQALVAYSSLTGQNPLQWIGAYIGGIGAGYTVNTLGFVSHVIGNLGRPMGEVVGEALLAMLMRYSLLDCGNLMITEGIKSSAVATTTKYAYMLMYMAGENRAMTGEWGISDGQMNEILNDLAMTIGQGVMKSAAKAVAVVPVSLTAIEGTFKAFDVGKTFGGVWAIYMLASGIAGSYF